MFFLIGAGISGGAKFVEVFNAKYLFYGVLMTLIPMIIGYLFAKYVLKLPLLNNLGSITGGMTSTPALGTLIQVSGTEDIATAYAVYVRPFPPMNCILCNRQIKPREEQNQNHRFNRWLWLFKHSFPIINDEIMLQSIKKWIPKCQFDTLGFFLALLITYVCTNIVVLHPLRVLFFVLLVRIGNETDCCCP